MTTGFDCVMIPGASKATAAKNPAPNSLCGQVMLFKVRLGEDRMGYVVLGWVRRGEVRLA
jgi:hypothetical protein